MNEAIQSKREAFASPAEHGVPDAIRLARRLTVALLLVMVLQASTGLLVSTAYRDVAWIKATWFGNDWVTLVVAVPLLIRALIRTAAGSRRGLLLWLGVVAYAVYNYAFYLFGAALNAFFPSYVIALVLALIVLMLALSRIDTRQVADCFRSTVPVRLIGGSLVFVGTGLGLVWIGLWAAYVFAGRPTPIDADAFRLVAALDLTLMVPALTIGGVLLWRRAPWGFMIAAIAGIQGALYLFVLSVNSIVAIRRGLSNAPGELPIWGTLSVFTATVTFLLLSNVRDKRMRPDIHERA